MKDAFSPVKDSLKEMLGGLPLTAELYFALRQRLAQAEAGGQSGPLFRLKRLEKYLAQWTAEVAALTPSPSPNAGRGEGSPLSPGPGLTLSPGPALGTTSPEGEGRRGEGESKRIALFGVLPYWIEHQMAISLLLAGLGHKVSLLYLPYGQYNRRINRFDLRRQNVAMQQVFAAAAPVLDVVPLLGAQSWVQPGVRPALPAELEAALRETTLRDTQYILQVEEVSTDSDIYRMRWERNTEAAVQALAWFQAQQPQVVIIPNGAILEFEAVYLAARYAGVKTVTYEFSELSRHIWLAQDADVMRQNTDALWAARKDQPLSEAQLQALRDLFAARQRPQLWQNFVFRYQGVGRAGAQKLRAQLGLDERPLILLAANVVGDSVTLGRQIFSESMTEWLERTVRYFAGRPQLQFVVRIHPGEGMTQGPSVAEIVHRALPAGLPENITLVAADAPVNTYDLIEIADLGLVYTTTAGLEMAMSGVPVMVVGRAHYRGRGFTLEADTWQAYFEFLDALPGRLAEVRMRRAEVDLAWNYAYRYFFEFPQPFPWHLYHFDADLAEWPFSRVLSPEGMQQFGGTLRLLAGEPMSY